MKKLLSIITILILLNSCTKKEVDPKGSVIFYSNSIGNDIYIYVNGELKGQITGYFPDSKPNCGDQYGVTVELKQGAYNFKAIDSINGDQWEYVFNVYKGECNPILLNR